MNKFGQKIRDCGRPRISSARPGAAMASVRHWAVPAVMAAALMLSGCQTLNPDSAEGASNSLLKAIAIAFVGGAAIWGSTSGGGSDDSPLLPTRAEEPTGLAGSFSEAEDQGLGRYSIDTPLLNAPAGGDGFQIEIMIPSDFRLLGALPGDCERGRCVVTIPAGSRSLGLILEPLPDAVVPPSPPMVSLIPSDDYDIQRVLTFREPIMQGSDLPGEIGRAVFTVFSNAPPSTGDRFVLSFQVEGLVPFMHVPGANPTTCDTDARICEVTIPDGETSAELIIVPKNPDSDNIPEWRLSLVPDDVDPAQNNDNYDILPTLGFFLAEQPPSVTRTGQATFTIISNTPAPRGGLDVRVTITGETFDIDETDANRLAAIAAIVGSQANHIPCDGSICTVRIPAGDTSVTFTLLPVGEANDDADAVNRWTVALIPGINFEIERDSNIDNPVEVENTPTGIRGGFIDLLITDTELRQVSIQTPVLDRVAGSNGFNIAFTLPANLRPVSGQTELDCTGTACTVTIPAGSRSLDLLFVPTPMVNPMGTGFTGEFGAPMVIDETTGEISIQTPTLDTAAPSGGTQLMFRLEDNFMLASGVPCPNNVCTVTILAGTRFLEVSIVPTPIAPTDPPLDLVEIEVPEENNDFEFLPLPPPPFVVGLGTPEPMVDPDTGDVISGDVTFTVRSDEDAPAGGLAVRFRIEGDAFIAMLPNADGTSTPLACSFQNVCTITILEGSDTAAFILVPEGPRSPDSDLFTRWTVAIVDDTRNNYGIDDDNPTTNVINEGITRIAAGETIVFDENTLVRFGDGNAPFRAFGQGNAQPDVLDIPSAAPVLAESEADSFDSGFYGHFADDGTVLPSAAELEELFGIVARYGGSFSLGNTNPATGEVELTFTPLGSPAPADGFPISFRVSGLSGSNDFTAARNDAADPADRTPVSCLGDVCTVTIPVGETALPGGNSLILSPTMAPSILDGILAPVWMVMQSTQEPGLVNPLLFNRASNDEAVFYAQRGNQLVARFETSGTLTETATVQEITYPAFNGVIPNFPSDICAGVPASSDGTPCSTPTFNPRPEVRLLVVGDDPGARFRAPRLGLSVGEMIPIDRPVAIALAITSTLVATADDAQELVYSYFQDGDGTTAPDGVIDVDAEGNQIYNTATVGSANFALYESGDIPHPSTQNNIFSINELDSGTELLGASNVRTFLFENEFSAIGAWLIPPTAEEVTADANAPYAAAAAHWFGFETPVDRVPTTGQAVYGGIAVGDFRQVTFDNAGVFAGKRSYYIQGFAQFDADFGTGEMGGRFELDAFDPRDAYGDPTFQSAQSRDTLIVEWQGGGILLDGSGFSSSVFEPEFDGGGDVVLDAQGNPVTTEIPGTATLFQPGRATTDEGEQLNPGRVDVFDDLVDFGTIESANPNLPAPIGSARFVIFGKFFGPGLGAFPEEVAGELSISNLRSTDEESVHNALEVHFTADQGAVPDDRITP